MNCAEVSQWRFDPVFDNEPSSYRSFAPRDASMNLGGARLDVVPFPASQPGNTLILGHGRPPASLLCGNNKLAMTTVCPLSVIPEHFIPK